MDTYTLAKLLLVVCILILVGIGLWIAINDSIHRQSSNTIVKYHQNGLDGTCKGNKYHRYNG